MINRQPRTSPPSILARNQNINARGTRLDAHARQFADRGRTNVESLNHAIPRLDTSPLLTVEKHGHRAGFKPNNFLARNCGGLIVTISNKGLTISASLCLLCRCHSGLRLLSQFIRSSLRRLSLRIRVDR